MKTLNFKKTVLGLSAFALIFTSCEKDENFDQEDQSVQKSELLKAKAYAESIGYHPDDITIADFMFPDGTTEERIYIEDDIALEPADFYALENMNIMAKQYRTSNLVTGANRTIDIIGYTGGSNALNATQQRAMRYAVDNYNNIGGSSLTFRLTFGTNFQDKDIVVYRNPNDNRTGGSAGFPSNGRPNKFVQLWTGMDNLSDQVNEHVITHEIGHSVGFRHSDYFSRQSCGQNSNEGGDRILVSGTPSGYDATSLMNACFSLGTDGEFNNNDRNALSTMY